MTPQIAPRTIIEAFLPFSGEVSMAAIYDAANLVGADAQPVRLAIRRLIASGDVVQRGRGRAGTLRLTSAGRQRLERDRLSLALAFAQDARDVRWDGRWHLIAVSVPERDRKVRDTLRRELSNLGAVGISTSLYLSPHDLADSLPVAARPYLTTASTGDISIQGISEPAAIAEALWPADPIVTAYTAISDVLGANILTTAIDPVVGQLHLADALERAMRNDPLIPPELRDGPWKPTVLRAAWARQWKTLRQGRTSLIYKGWWSPRMPEDH